MEYRSKYKAEEIETILDAKNNTGEGVDSNLDVLFTGQLQTKEVEVSEDTIIKADEGFLGLKEVSVKVSGGGGGTASSWKYISVPQTDQALMLLPAMLQIAQSCKTLNSDGNHFVGGTALAYNGNTTRVEAIGFDMGAKVCENNFSKGQMMTLGDIFSTIEGGMTFLQMLEMYGFAEITESEFYAL